jgi:1,4-dihydroxy-2-naphthoyl-CoA synthase
MMRSLLWRSTSRLPLATTTPALKQPRTGSAYCLLSLRSSSQRWSSNIKDSYDYITVEKRTVADDDAAAASVALITLNRPQALNALCDALFEDLIHAATAVDSDDSIGCLVLTGSTKAFAAGADISEMKDKTFDYAYKKVRGTQRRCLV